MAFLRRTLPLSEFLAAAARLLVEEYRHLLPDLSTVTVVLPTLHGAAPLARELAAAAGVPALLVPRITTLSEWASEVAVPQKQVSDSERELQLFEALKGRGWLRDADLWHVAGELRRLCDELTRERVPLPGTEQGFSEILGGAYQAPAGESLHFEARLVFEAWRALVPDENSADAVNRYHLRLARRLEAPPGPLVAAGLETLSRAERQFLERYGERAPVMILEPAPENDPVAVWLAAAWPPRAGHDDLPDLPARASAIRAESEASPLQGRVALCGAGGLEQEARVADARVRAWLLDGKERIAVVAQDRLAARRLRALLERAGVQVEDETGWTLSTVAAATVIMRLLDCVSGDFYHQDLLDLLKSPLVFADLEPQERKAAVHYLETVVRRESVIGGLAAIRGAVSRALERDPDASRALAGDPKPVGPWFESMRGAVALLGLLERVAGAAGALATSPGPVGPWLDRLAEALRALGATDALAKDAAGRQLLELFRGLRRELGSSGPAVTFSEWRRWLDRQLESATFRDRDVESPVVFTHLAATRLRGFDGVVLLGCDAAHLPGGGEPGLFLNQSVRRALGLPTREDDLEQMRRDLVAVIAGAGEVFVTWQRQLRGEHNLVSPMFELLEAFHVLAHGTSLEQGHWLAVAAAAEVCAGQAGAPQPMPAGAPAPAAAPLVPARISVSGYGSLVGCPYQFYARHMLRLNELDEVREDVEKRDYGEVLHAILKVFHDRFPLLTGLDRSVLEQELAQASERRFAELLSANYLATAWLLRWKAMIPAYLDWQLEREAQGWRYGSGEASREREVALAAGRVILRGRLDRLDRRATADGEEWAVLDYKTQSHDSLRKKVKEPGEDVQLSSYALLQAGVTEAAFLCLDKQEPKPVAPADAPALLAERELARFTDAFQRLLAGAPLPAQGDEATCNWCEMQGLCRRAYWP